MKSMAAIFKQFGKITSQDQLAIEKLQKIEKRIDCIIEQNKILKEALTYCANHARPSIVQDVAKEALEKCNG